MSKPFPRDAHLTSIAIAYSNPEVSLIADKVLPRIKVGKSTFKYFSYPEGQMYTVPSTLITETGQANRVSVSGTQVESSVEDRGIKIPLTQRTLDEAPKGVDPKAKATERAMNIVLLDRERQVAAMCFDPANFPASNKLQLGTGGNKRLNDNTGDPLGILLAGLDACLVRPNKIAFGQAAWRKFSTTPKVVSASLGNSGESGVALRQRIADLLEVNEIVVGSGYVNSAKPGKDVTLSPCWGNAVLAYFTDPTVDTTGGLTFGFTAQLGEAVAGFQDVEMGLGGGIEVRAGESTVPLIVAPRAAFLWTDATA